MKNKHIFLSVLFICAIFVSFSPDVTLAHTNTPTLLNPMVNGTVYSTAITGNSIFFGGDFSIVGPAVGSGVPVGQSTGNPFNPESLERLNDAVFVSVIDGQGGWYVGGDFTAVNGSTHNRLAHIFSDGRVDENFNPDVNGTVRSLAVSPDGQTLYVGGDFTEINGTPRNFLGSVYTTDGSLHSWNPAPSNTVHALLLNSSGSTLYVGGNFTAVNGGTTRRRLAAYNTADNTLTSWNPNSNGSVRALAIKYDESIIYVGGNFTTIGGNTRTRLAAINTSNDLVTSWAPSADDMVFTVSLNADESVLFVGGQFLNLNTSVRNYAGSIDTTTGAVTSWDPAPTDFVRVITNTASNGLGFNEVYIGGDFNRVNGVNGPKRKKIASFEEGVNTPTPWNPRANDSVRTISVHNGSGVIYLGGDFSSLGGEDRDNLAAFNKEDGLLHDWVFSANGVVNTMVVGNDNTTVYVGGDFTTINGVARNGLAAFTLDGGMLAWNPNANGSVQTMALNSDGTQLYVGGSFTTVGGLTRNRAAAVNTSDGTVLSFNPNADNTVHSITLSPNNETVYLGGAFLNVGGIARNRMASVNASDSLLTGFNPDINGIVRAIKVDLNGQTIYAGGDFTTVNGVVARNFIASLASSTGNATSWNPSADTIVRALELTPDGRTIIAGGDFTTIGGASRSRLAALKVSNGLADLWDPSVNNSVYDLSLSDNNGSSLYAGGSFRKVNGLNRRGIAHFRSPYITLASGASAGAESVTSVGIPVVLSEPNMIDTTIDFAIIPNSGDAIDPEDFTLAPGTLVIAAGETSGNIVLNVVNDTLFEIVEGVSLSIFNPKNASYNPFNPPNLTYGYTIEDDDEANQPTVSFALASTSINESGGTALVRVQLSHLSGKHTSAEGTISGSATGGGVDYSYSHFQANILPGDLFTDIVLNITDDLIAEGNETIVLTMTNVSSGIMGSPSVHTITIVDND